MTKNTLAAALAALIVAVILLLLAALFLAIYHYPKVVMMALLGGSFLFLIAFIWHLVAIPMAERIIEARRKRGEGTRA